MALSEVGGHTISTPSAAGIETLSSPTHLGLESVIEMHAHTRVHAERHNVYAHVHVMKLFNF